MLSPEPKSWCSRCEEFWELFKTQFKANFCLQPNVFSKLYAALARPPFPWRTPICAHLEMQMNRAVAFSGMISDAFRNGNSGPSETRYPFE